MANHYHIFCACPKIKLFWQGIVAEIVKILGVEVDFSFTTIYLGKIPGNIVDKDKSLLKILLASGRKAITHKWLHIDPPKKNQWLGILNEIYSI